MKFTSSVSDSLRGLLGISPKPNPFLRAYHQSVEWFGLLDSIQNPLIMIRLFFFMFIFKVFYTFASRIVKIDPLYYLALAWTKLKTLGKSLLEKLLEWLLRVWNALDVTVSWIHEGDPDPLLPEPSSPSSGNQGIPNINERIERLERELLGFKSPSQPSTPKADLKRDKPGPSDSEFLKLQELASQSQALGEELAATKVLLQETQRGLNESRTELEEAKGTLKVTEESVREYVNQHPKQMGKM